MGISVKAACKCGFTKEILVGGSKLDTGKVEYFPFLCKTCLEMVQGNLIEANPICSECNTQKMIPYNDASLTNEDCNEVFVRCYDDIITKGKYFCPKCIEKSLRFTEILCFFD